MLGQRIGGCSPCDGVRMHVEETVNRLAAVPRAPSVVGQPCCFFAVPGADEIAQRDDGDEPTRGVEGEGELTSTPGQPNSDGTDGRHRQDEGALLRHGRTLGIISVFLTMATGMRRRCSGIVGGASSHEV